MYDDYLSLYEVRLFINLFRAQLTVGCDTLNYLLYNFGNFRRQEALTIFIRALGQLKFFRLDVLTPSHFAKMRKAQESQLTAFYTILLTLHRIIPLKDQCDFFAFAIFVVAQERNMLPFSTKIKALPLFCLAFSNSSTTR